jgi:hypothetical protein
MFGVPVTVGGRFSGSFEMAFSIANGTGSGATRRPAVVHDVPRAHRLVGAHRRLSLRGDDGPSL